MAEGGASLPVMPSPTCCWSRVSRSVWMVRHGRDSRQSRSKGRYLDNIFIERLRRTVKYEEGYLKAYDTVREARAGIDAYMNFYNNERPHQSLGYRTPAHVYHVRFRSNIRHRTPIVNGEALHQLSDTAAADSLNSALLLSN